MLKTVDCVLRKLPWKHNWFLILVIRISFRKWVMQQKDEDIKALFAYYERYRVHRIANIGNFTDFKEGKENKNCQNFKLLLLW